MMEVNRIAFSNFEFTYNDGEWLWKAINIPLKKKISEQPQYKVVHDIEKKYQESYSSYLSAIVKDVNEYLNVITKTSS